MRSAGIGLVRIFGWRHHSIRRLLAVSTALLVVDRRLVVDAVRLYDDDAVADDQRDGLDGLEHDRVGTDAGLAADRYAPVAVELEVGLLLDLEVVVLLHQLIAVAAIERAGRVADVQVVVAI